MIALAQRFKVYENAYPHFVTCTVVHWIPVFCRDDYFKVLTDSLVYCIEHKGLLIHGYVIMPNHFHAICSKNDGCLSDTIRDVKRYTAISLSQKLKSDGRHIWLIAMRRAGGITAQTKVWDDGFHPEQIQTEAFFIQKLDYIHKNPIRAGYVEDPCDWKYSSAAFYYDGRESVLPLTPIDW